jgi:FtsZ-interacting cell division protein YlmF
MTDNLLKRARAFIGLEEGEELEGKQMEIPSVAKSRKSDEDYEILVYEPRVYEDSLNISANLRSGQVVIINIKSLEQTEGTRLIDFVCGTAYAIDGHMMKIGETIFLFVPANVKIVDAEEKTTLGDELSSSDERKSAFLFSR